MRRRWLGWIGVGVLCAAATFPEARAARGAPVKNARISAPERRPLVVAETSVAAPWAAKLGPVRVMMQNTRARADVRLYGADGRVDEGALAEFLRVAASAEGADEPHPTRLVQLVVRAAYHFGGARVVIVSGTRKGARGKHGSGEAIDFRLDGVRASKLASYLRSLPRVGVGIYTHPKTQFVHLDVRDRSFHWIDASPPGVTWKERALRDAHGDERDARYVAAMDLPELARAR